MGAADVRNNLALAEKTVATSRKNKKRQRVNSVCLHLPATGLWVSSQALSGNCLAALELAEKRKNFGLRWLLENVYEQTLPATFLFSDYFNPEYPR